MNMIDFNTSLEYGKQICLNSYTFDSTLKEICNATLKWTPIKFLIVALVCDLIVSTIYFFQDRVLHTMRVANQQVVFTLYGIAIIPSVLRTVFIIGALAYYIIGVKVLT